MPRTTKEVKEENIKKTSKKRPSVVKEKTTTAKKEVAKKSTSKSTTAKKVATASKTKKAATTTKKVTAKKADNKKEVVKKETKKVPTKKAATKKSTTKTTTAKKATTSSKTKKVATTKKETAKKNTTKTTAAKKVTTTSSKTKKAAATTKKTTKKSTTSKAKKVTAKNSIDVLEYYDLPYRYNQTIVKILAQTPKTLFVYWDISDNDRKSYIDQYGENFFENTKPVLIIHNETMNYAFEIEINDFANCWYFNINDEKCDYRVELGRRPKNSEMHIDNDYLYITSSIGMESPNGHILFEKEQKTLYYRNVKTNEILTKDVASLDFMKRLGRIYKIYDIYKKLYKDDEFLKAGNPSSKFI